jgi:hypothetical protein
VRKVLYSFGREDQLDKEAVRRLVASLSKLLDPAGAQAASAAEDLVFTEARPYGGTYVLDAMWHRLGIGKILTRLHGGGQGRPQDAAAAERVLFGLVANRALAPSSKLAAAEWMSRDVHIDGLGDVSDDACCRVRLHAVCGDLEKQVYFGVADFCDEAGRQALCPRRRQAPHWRSPRAHIAPRLAQPVSKDFTWVIMDTLTAVR